ncbi:hypothetical protein JZO77_16490 [Enterococcus hulanensis]|uniref:SpaA isopeptide-forming pilin-related protein n=1 Tax=Enterococcus hulanensis TaxID=2559929 RepID=UPI001A8DAA38|nr:SpaA isopeptide-forming pilin-related protein [Enterococcus hulanensis]MBO0458333.1 hypothetical protein [Enterococcus hulanensis]
MLKKKFKIVLILLLPAIFLLGILFMISSNPLQATDTAKQEQTSEKDSTIDVETKEVAGKTVMMVPTEETEKKIDELTEKNYKPNESLVTPVIALSENSSGASKTPEKSGKSADIQVPKAGIKVMDGTASWDPTTGNPDGPTSDANAGRDSSATNGVVRSWDQITYLLDFSVQNMSVDTTYTNIKYQVTATLHDAVTMMPDGTTPQLNGLIANGQTYKADGTLVQEEVTEAGYSEGTVESTISNTGQVFIPIVVNVLGAPNAQKLKPTFQVKIVSADKENEDGTTETVTMDEIYDNSDFSSLSPAATAVTAKPSVSVNLVQGQEFKGAQASTVLGGDKAGEDQLRAWNIGAAIGLKALPSSGTNPARPASDFRGATFPTGHVTFKLGLKGTYQVTGETTTQNLSNSQASEMTVQAVSPALGDSGRPSNTWVMGTGGYTVPSIDAGLLTSPLSVPYANTQRLFMNQPSGDRSKIGVYDSGTFSAVNENKTTMTNTAEITNSGYVGVYNPYTYNMNGSAYSSSTVKPYSSTEMIVRWHGDTTQKLAESNRWNRYDMTLFVESVNYDGIESDGGSSVDYPTVVTSSGSYGGGVVMNAVSESKITHLNKVGKKVASVSAGSTDLNLNPGGLNLIQNGGNARIPMGSELSFFYNSRTSNDRIRRFDNMIMWDPTAFKLDVERYKRLDVDITLLYAGTNANEINQFFGVAKNINNTAPYNYNSITNNMEVSTMSNNHSKYVWYSSMDEAVAAGDVSAVYTQWKSLDWHAGSSNIMRTGAGVFVKNISTNVGNKTPAGNPLVVLGGTVFFDANDQPVYEPAVNNTSGGSRKGNYYPTIYNSDGTVQSTPATYTNWVGESGYVEPFGITTKTKVAEGLYESDKEIDIKVRGMLSGSESQDYDTTLNTTLPKGISYKPDSATDAQGEALPNPTITENSDGTTTLRWDFPKTDIKNGTEVNFKVTSNISQLSFDDTGLTSNLTVSTVGEMWVTGDKSNKDESVEASRSSSDTFRVKLDQQLVLTKKIDKKAIEVGTVDPADSEAESSTDITYTVTGENNSTQDMTSLKLLDVLPYNGDSRKTNYHGDYRVQSVTATIVDPTGKPLPAPAKSKMFYTTDAPSSSTYDEKSDPNTISGWTEATTSDPVPSDAKGVLVEATDMPTGGKLILKITIRPNGKQKAGDMYRNNARLNSVIDNAVTSQVVETKIYARDLAGYVWYDDDYDGLIGNKSNGLPEDPVENIPVKLYRTSLKDSSYKNELVKNSLTGEKFIDDSGNSLIRTDVNGKYKFENLPEGKYIAEFIVDDLVVQKIAIITKQSVGSDDTKNSKADPNDYKTPSYQQPKLEDLPAQLSGSDKVYHIMDVNAGLTRMSKLRLFKYEEGSVIDSNEDGKLSEAEIESSGRPLKGAEFDLYKGNSTNATDKIGSAKTDSSGWLEYPGLIPGDYTIVETKAPNGFELLKDPVKVTISTYNSIVKVHVSNDGKTDLPFTGGAGPMFIVVMIVSVLGIIGLGGFYWYYQHPNEKGEG